MRTNLRRATFLVCPFALCFATAVPCAAIGPSAAGMPTGDVQLPPANPCEVLEGNSITPTTPFARTIGDDVTLVVRDLDACVKQERILPSDLRADLDGTMLPKLSPIVGPLGQNYVKFTLRMDPYDKDDRTRWAKIIHALRQSSTGVTFTLANAKTGQAFPSAQRIRIDLYPNYTPYVIVLLVVLLGGLVVLAARSNMLRDKVVASGPPGVTCPVSLGRVQMAFWFYLVVAGYLYIWLLTGQSYTPTGSILTLLGISSATGFAAAIVDRNKASEDERKRTALEIEKQTLETRIREIEAISPAPGSDLARDLMLKKDRLPTVLQELAMTPAPAPNATRGFFKDLFCDGDGVSFHRFQMIVWTIVLGIVFARAVDLELAMPDFDSTLLGLMGLSAGTYIGFKFPEKTK